MTCDSRRFLAAIADRRWRRAASGRAGGLAVGKIRIPVALSHTHGRALARFERRKPALKRRLVGLADTPRIVFSHAWRGGADSHEKCGSCKKSTHCEILSVIPDRLPSKAVQSNVEMETCQTRHLPRIR
jgi:hypothetical protein